MNVGGNSNMFTSAGGKSATSVGGNSSRNVGRNLSMVGSITPARRATMANGPKSV